MYARTLGVYPEPGSQQQATVPVGFTYIFLVGVEKPECEVTGLGGSSILTQGCGISGQKIAR